MSKNNAQEREYFTFYRSFLATIQSTPAEYHLPLFECIADFALNGREPEMENYSNLPFFPAIWSGIRATLHASRVKWLNGSNGGAPKGNGNARKQPRNNQETTEIQAINNKQITNNNKQVTNNKYGDRHKVPPLFVDVENFFLQELRLNDARAFFDYYESVGWVVGKKKMRDWQAAARGWQRRNFAPAAGTQDRREIPQGGHDENNTLFQ